MGLGEPIKSIILIFLFGFHQNKSNVVLVHFFIAFSKHETWVVEVITDFHDKSHKSEERVILLELCKLI